MAVTGVRGVTRGRWRQVHPVRGHLDRLADTGQRDRPLAQHGTRADGQVLYLDAIGLVGLLEPVTPSGRARRDSARLAWSG